jgi:uncharacterized protein YbcC (UPF0753/DUF2309 family)
MIMKENLTVENIKKTAPVEGKNKQMTYDVDSLVNHAAKFLTPVWPMETFIACNPLQGFEDEPFDEAVKQSFQMHRLQHHSSRLELVNKEMIKWSGAFLDMGQGTIEMPHREKGFYRNFCELALFDYQLHLGQQAIKNWLAKLPQTPQEAIIMCLNGLNIPPAQYEEFLVQNFSYLPGWGGYVKWLSLWSNSKHLKNKLPINLVQYMAVRLVITYVLWPEIVVEKKNEILSHDYLLELESIKNNESDYSKTLIQNMRQSLPHLNQEQKTPDVQMVFCIDVRSEPFRNKLERLGAYETLGFAGFFGLPVRIHDYAQRQVKECCPVLLKPRFDIYTDIEGSSKEKSMYENRQDLLNSFVGAYQQLKYNYTTPFNLADAMGPWCGVGMFFKNFYPEFFQTFVNFIKNKLIPNVDTKLSIKCQEQHHGIPEKEQIAYADVILRLMGLTKNFAKVVVFCGHQSTTTNNPYASALDCGACGGNHGGDNAKILASILNQPFIRKALKENGIDIPHDTVFMSAAHDTTTDECWLHEKSSGKHQDLLKNFKAHLQLAQQQNATYRSQFFDNNHSVLKKSLNWSEARPEWGLARNAAFIVAPRLLTKDMNLDGRCFLHSYDWEIDDHGQLLETILTAPMVVAQWINCQYLFSTLDNVNYGSGSKITHNVVGKFGIMQGNGSDLMHGLALQSVNANDKDPFHQPQRLLSVVYAPRSRVEKLIEKHEILQKLFLNQWVHLLVIDPQDKSFYRLESNNSWTRIGEV